MFGGRGGGFGSVAFSFQAQLGGQRGEFLAFGGELVGVFERSKVGAAQVVEFGLQAQALLLEALLVGRQVLIEVLDALQQAAGLGGRAVFRCVVSRDDARALIVNYAS